jgi:hypothetical protein
MMKKLFLFTIVMSTIVFNHVSAQKVDLDKYRFSIGSMYTLPNDPLPEDYKTFNAKATIGKSIELDENTIENKFNIGGWNRLENTAKAHLSIAVSLGNLIIDKSEIKESKSESKDKAGKVTVSYSYTVTYQYSMGANYKITDYNGKSYSCGSYLKPSGSFNSDNFSTYSAASNYKNDNNFALRDRFTNELIDRYINQINRDMTSKWGLSTVGSNDHFWLMDSKKHPEQDSMQIYAKFIKEKMPIFTANMVASEFIEVMSPFIGYLERLPSRYKTDEKNDKKLRYSSYYNLAKLYWYLDDVDKSDAYADLLIKNDYDKDDGEDIKKDNVKLRAIFSKAKINKRHLSFDTSTFMGPK